MALTKDDKIYLNNLLDRQEKRFEDKVTGLEDKFEEKLTGFRNDFYNKIDPILGEVVASREDRLIGTEQHIRNEKRIEKLEKIHPQGRHVAVT